MTYAPSRSQKFHTIRPSFTKYAILASLCLIVAASAMLSGCSSKRSAFEGKGSPIYKGSGPIPKGGGRQKLGSPYQIAGRWYTPRVDPTYDRTGTASWYGSKFHRRMTANGEWYDMNQLTAAHPTLPLPSFAKVTNLENGRTVTVRINDRGPYAHDRVIDLSRKSARALGVIRRGTARVRVQYLGPAPLSATAANYYAPSARRVMTASSQPARRTGRRPNPYATASASPRGTPRNILPSTLPASRIDSPAGAIYVQAASYSNVNNALRAKTNLARIGPVEMTRIQIGARAFYRVRVGPLQNPSRARATLMQVVDAGHDDARIVTY